MSENPSWIKDVAELCEAMSRQLMAQAKVLHALHARATGGLACPKCGQQVLLPSKFGGFWCPASRGGCGGTFTDEDMVKSQPPLEPASAELVETLVGKVSSMGSLHDLQDAARSVVKSYSRGRYTREQYCRLIHEACKRAAMVCLPVQVTDLKKMTDYFVANESISQPEAEAIIRTCEARHG